MISDDGCCYSTMLDFLSQLLEYVIPAACNHIGKAWESTPESATRDLMKAMNKWKNKIGTNLEYQKIYSFPAGVHISPWLILQDWWSLILFGNMYSLIALFHPLQELQHHRRHHARHQCSVELMCPRPPIALFRPLRLHRAPWITPTNMSPGFHTWQHHFKTPFWKACHQLLAGAPEFP